MSYQRWAGEVASCSLAGQQVSAPMNWSCRCRFAGREWVIC